MRCRRTERQLKIDDKRAAQLKKGAWVRTKNGYEAVLKYWSKRQLYEFDGQRWHATVIVYLPSIGTCREGFAWLDETSSTRPSRGAKIALVKAIMNGEVRL